MADNASQSVVIFWGDLDFSFIGFLSLIVVECVLMEIKLMGEGMFAGDLLIDESVQVEDNPLQMDGEDFGDLGDPRFLRNVHILAAEVALIIID